MTGFTAMATVINSVLATNFHFRGILGFLLQPTSIGFPETAEQPNELIGAQKSAA